MADGARSTADGAAPIDLAASADAAAGPLLIRPSLCEVQIGDLTEKLEPRVMQVLVALHRAEGRLVSRDDLIQLCWGGLIVTDDAINRVLVRLRRLVAKTRGRVRIETIRSMGYRLIAESGTAAATPSLRTRRGMVISILSTVAVAAVLAGAVLLWRPAPDERLAVLPFRAEPSLRTVSERMAERVRGALSIGDLDTLARVRPEDYRSEEMSRRAARDSVRFVLDGVVIREGDDLVVTMQVIDAPANLALWTKEYRRPRSEALWLEEQIAAHAAEVLRCALVSRRQGDAPVKPAVIAAFMRACDRVEQFEAGGSDMLAAARELTVRAPRFSRAWSMLAVSAAMAAVNVPATRARALRTEARQAAERAQQLDPSNGESFLALSFLLPEGSAFQERDALISRAIKVDPTLSDAHVVRAGLLMEVGRTSEALAHLRDAAALDPLAPSHWVALVPVLSTNGQFAEAARLRERLLQVWPQSPAARHNAFKNRMFNDSPAEALAMLDRGTVAFPSPVQSAIRQFLEGLVARDPYRLRASARALNDLARRGVYDPRIAISSASMAGDLDLAFDLSGAYYAGALSGLSPSTPARAATSHFMFLPPAENMRRDPRFMQLSARAGLITYWRATGVWPDFCRRPGLPYNCVTEAEKALPPGRG